MPGRTQIDKLTQDEIVELTLAFFLFDTEYRGTIKTSQVGAVLRSLERDPTEVQDIEAMMDSFDSSGNGTLSLVEFLTMIAMTVVDSDDYHHGVFRVPHNNNGAC